MFSWCEWRISLPRNSINDAGDFAFITLTFEFIFFITIISKVSTS